jgi:hypothetical protein
MKTGVLHASVSFFYTIFMNYVQISCTLQAHLIIVLCDICVYMHEIIQNYWFDYSAYIFTCSIIRFGHAKVVLVTTP